MAAIRREIVIFFGLFVLLSLAVHFQAWLDHPIQHLNSLPHSSMGPLHPLFLTLALYLVVAIVRGGIYLIGKVLAK